MKLMLLALSIFINFDSFGIDIRSDRFVKITNLEVPENVSTYYQTRIHFTVSNLPRNARYIRFFKKNKTVDLSNPYKNDCVFFQGGELGQYKTYPLNTSKRGYPTRIEYFPGFFIGDKITSCRVQLLYRLLDKNRKYITKSNDIDVVRRDRVAISPRKNITITDTFVLKKFFNFTPAGPFTFCAKQTSFYGDIAFLFTPRAIGYDCQYSGDLKTLPNGVKLVNVHWLDNDRDNDYMGCCISKSTDGKSCVKLPGALPPFLRGKFNIFRPNQSINRRRAFSSFFEWGPEISYKDPTDTLGEVIYRREAIKGPHSYVKPGWFRVNCLPNNNNGKLFTLRLERAVFSVPEHFDESDIWLNNLSL